MNNMVWANVVSLSLDELMYEPAVAEHAVPRSIRIKYHFLSTWVQEELDLLKEEMTNVIQHYINDRQVLLQCAEETTDVGAICLLKKELTRIDAKLKCLCKAYQPYITTPDLPMDIESDDEAGLEGDVGEEEN